MNLRIKEKILTKFSKLYNTNSNYFKIQKLPNWINFYTNELNKELQNRRKVKFNQYKQGTVIMAELGVNIGDEMSGPHFCVVINKNNTQYDHIITILPLTSHNKKRYLPLNENIAIKNLQKIKSELLKLNQILINNNKNPFEVRQQIIVLNNQLEITQNFNKETYVDTMNIRSIDKSRIFKYSKFSISENFVITDKNISRITNKIITNIVK